MKSVPHTHFAIRSQLIAHPILVSIGHSSSLGKAKIEFNRIVHNHLAYFGLGGC